MVQTSVYMKTVVDILENHSFKYHKDVKSLFFHTFSKTSKFEVLFSYLIIWKHLISVASAQEILYNQAARILH